MIGKIIHRFAWLLQVTGQGVSLLEVSCGCRTGFGFASPNWVCRTGRETKIPWGCPENVWGRHACNACQSSSFSFTSFIGDLRAIQYPFMSLWVKKVQSQTLRGVSGSCGKVLSCSGGKMFSGWASKASPFHDQRLQGQDGAAKLIQTEVWYYFFCVCVCVKSFAMAGATSGFYCTPEFSLCFKRQNRKRNTSTVKCAGNILKRSYKGWMDLLHPRLLSFQYFFLEEEGENVPFQEASHCWMQGIKLTLNIKMTGSQTNLNWNLKSWMFHK